MTAKKEAPVVTIPALKLKTFQLHIVGDSPLLVHAWSEKAKRTMLESQQQKAPTSQGIRRPHVEFADSLYWLTEKPNLDDLTDEEAQEVLAKVIPQSKFGFPTIAFKAAALDGSFQQGLLAAKAGGSKLAKTTARGAILVLGEFAEIEGTPTLHQSEARIGGSSRTTDLRFRGEFKEWETKLNIRYNSDAISMEQIVTLFYIGGFSVGVGEWRNEKGGRYGMFHVE